MTGGIDENLDRALRTMTEYPGEAASSVDKALARTRGSLLGRMSATPVGSRTFGLCAVAALAIGAAVFVQSLTLGTGSRPFRGLASMPPSARPFTHAMDAAPATEQDQVQALDRVVDLSNSPQPQLPRDWFGAKSPSLSRAEEPQSPALAGGAAPDTDRQVVRKATLELLTPDVAAVFLKASHVVQAASGEFVQESALTGVGKDAQGNLTLRVAATRLDAALNELRSFGVVRAESTSGEDVTAQIVDVDSRVRNEERVETELLELLAKRADAPLKEILELRERISDIRQRIEQYTTQRQRLSRLVSLATVLVIIRPDQAAATIPKESGIGAYLRDSFAGAWKEGLVSLTDSLAWLVRVALGGFAWWVLLLVAVIGIWRGRRWRLGRAAAPPFREIA